jgi:signal transduction histidine kinase
MTLRHRLLLVYGIVVLLSIATISMAVFESTHARQIIRELQDWNGIVLNVEKLKSSWPPPAAADDFDLKQLLAEQFLSLANAPDYLDKDRVLKALYRVYRQYDIWKNQSAALQSGSLDLVRKALDELAMVVGFELTKLNNEADRQASRTRTLLVMVTALTILHVAVIASLLRRWLLHPMEQLSRQVEALGRNQPPAEPLLNSPQEMASLAQAMDKARRSLDGLRQKLIESERLTTIGQLSAQLAHNLRNPLASIRAAAQVTLRHTSDDAAARTRMQDIMASVDRLDRWIAGLMEIARRDATPTRVLDVVPTLHRVRDALAPELHTKEMTIAIEAPADGLACAHDPVTLEHALIAMIVNAIEASPLGGHITLQAEKIAPNGRPGSICRISVIDEGTGLPPDSPERIFEFAYSTKQKGIGLGLALARQTLQRQGGCAYARNNPTRGATVYVELPMETAANAMSC